jgi:RimJ/RimL family protein N-acetyltransferase
MANFRDDIIELFNFYKNKNQPGEYQVIPVFTGEVPAGFLKPVTFDYKKMYPNYIPLFSQWRRENSHAFPNLFEITERRTEKWIDEYILNREDRILFVLHSVNDAPLGHLGLWGFDFESRTCEIDNVLRGQMNGFRGIMSLALNTMINWGKLKFNPANIYLKVLSDNVHAINFYRKNNFIEQSKIPLFKVVDNNEIKWVEITDIADRAPDRFYTLMKLV